MSQINQVELARYSALELQKEKIEAESASLHRRFIEAGKEAVAAGKVDAKGYAIVDQEPGSLRVVVRIGDKVANVDWKEVQTVIREKNCTFVNGGGKVRGLNEILDDIVEKARGKTRPENNSATVKPNILA